MSRTTIERMWINQPSTLQPHHDLNGVRVLAIEECPGTMRVYFLDGPVSSQQMSPLALSAGWPEHLCGSGTKTPPESDKCYCRRANFPHKRVPACAVVG